ncbi:MAG: leucine--tRNA ligase [Bacteroidota bacterium]
MINYDFQAIEQKWQQYWATHHTFRTAVDVDRPKYYVLDMFPYPSGEGLHVGHPLGYIASDIVARYKRSKGYNVLHPMGFDAFGLPAEQYAMQTGQHPAVITAKNIRRYQEQLQRLGLGYDWGREILTSDPAYYRWTQWIFLQLFESWYDTSLQKAQPIERLVAIFQQAGNGSVEAACDEDIPIFTARAWQQMTEQQQQLLLLKYRLAFLADTTVNWCPALGTVLANEEVKDGFAERGGYPVIRKQMQQWCLRITAYADRLADDLERLSWPTSTKEMQRNWIGRSVGTALTFEAQTQQGQAYPIQVFTTRPDTIFGVTYLALSPGHPLVNALTTPSQHAAVEAYVTQALRRAANDRLDTAKQVTGVFTGTHAIHPFTGKRLPIWVADYVVAGYGPGAVMGVPAHDSRDHAFAKHFELPIIQVIAGADTTQAAYEAAEGTLINADFLDGLSVQEATTRAMQRLEETQIGTRKTLYRLRDAIFSRQRYWGEPFPIYYKDGIPYALPAAQLPLELPTVKACKPTTTGQPALGNAANWQTQAGHPLELSTMPGWAGSSWYFFRYMDPHNATCFVGDKAQAYWQSVDLYIGGAEHTTGHLLYARFWTKFLYDLGYVRVQEPFQQLINQGMIQGKSSFVYRIKGTNQFVSYHLRHDYDTIPMHVAIDLVEDDVLDVAAFRQWRPELATASFVLEDGQYICGSEVEKMSKSKYNVVSPDTVIAKYGADTLRLYTMFLGPIDQTKPWDTHGIEGVFRFITKVWRLFHEQSGIFTITEQSPSLAARKAVHKAIKKVEEAIRRYTFNTAVSTLMVCANELTALSCNSKGVLQDFVRLLAPFAPHLAEELWQLLGHTQSVAQAPFPKYDAQYLQEDTIAYPIAVNGKVRATITFELGVPQETIEKRVLTHTTIQKWLQGQPPQRVIIVPQKMVNVVV